MIFHLYHASIGGQHIDVAKMTTLKKPYSVIQETSVIILAALFFIGQDKAQSNLPLLCMKDLQKVVGMIYRLWVINQKQAISD
jgi:hypothetical protein